MAVLFYLLFWHRIAFFSVCVCMCWFYYFLENQKADLSAPLCLTLFSTCWLLRKMRCDWTMCGTGAVPVLRASADVVKGRAGVQAWGEWEKRVEENWGFLWSPLSRSEEQRVDQSGLFYVAGAILWSPRVTYSTHFIKFTSVLIADQ